jgi:hypothetical protein
VDQFWGFAAHYWWLAFPLFGVVAAAGRGWERNARRRHERRLEVLRTKGEIRAAQIAARKDPKAVGSARPAQKDAALSPLAQLFADHDDVRRRWLDYELDVSKAIAYPAMSDGRQPLTAAFLRAGKKADRLRPAEGRKVSADELREYREAVTDYEVAFDLAERDARRLRDSGFTEAERKRLHTAQQLLTVAVDEAATPAERQLAYQRVREELDGLISLSDEALDVLEKKVALEITAPKATPTAHEATSGPDRA